MVYVCIMMFEGMWVWILSTNLYALPLHEGLVQSLFSWWGPWHSAQPCTDGLQRLCLCWVPVLHVTLHVDQGPHSDHWPSTGQRERDERGWRETEEWMRGRRHGGNQGKVMQGDGGGGVSERKGRSQETRQRKWMAMRIHWAWWTI